ncbi:MAG: hypothetical protein ACTTJW_08510 [Sphaerochaeta sp.]
METLEEKVDRHDKEIKEIKKDMEYNNKSFMASLNSIKKDVKIAKDVNKKYGKLTVFLLCLVIALFGVLFATNAEQAKAIAQYTATGYKAATII